jgi:SagB-type dehydrogenase family enzyme
LSVAAAGILLGAALVCAPTREEAPVIATASDAIRLPEPLPRGVVSVEEALRRRRSQREWSSAPLTLVEVAQLLWAAQGRTSPDGRRTAPSAGALYPVELGLLAGDVEGLAPSVYRYRPDGHLLEPVLGGDRRRALADAAFGQDWLRSAPACLVVGAVYERTASKYGARAERYVQIEAGAVAQNVALQAVALGLGTVVVGAFDDVAVARVMGLAPEERPLAILPVGH